MSLENSFCMINGTVYKTQNAHISISDRGFLFGHGVFETLLVQNEKIIDWKAHYARMKIGCQKARLVCPESKQLSKDCKHIVNETLNQSAKTDKERTKIKLSLKVIITGGNCMELLLQNNPLKTPSQNIYLLCQPTIPLSLTRRLEGLKVQSFLDRRGDFFKEIKSLNYLYHFICLDEAKLNQFDDAIFFNDCGEYTEGVTSSFIWFNDQDEIFTTPPKGQCLAGTSLLKLKRGLKDRGMSIHEKALLKNETTNAQGCALLSSVRGIVPISQIDKITFDVKKHANFFKKLIEIFDTCE